MVLSHVTQQGLQVQLIQLLCLHKRKEEMVDWLTGHTWGDMCMHRGKPVGFASCLEIPG